jgi:hypothetical protein
VRKSSFIVLISVFLLCSLFAACVGNPSAVIDTMDEQFQINETLIQSDGSELGAGFFNVILKVEVPLFEGKSGSPAMDYEFIALDSQENSVSEALRAALYSNLNPKAYISEKHFAPKKKEYEDWGRELAGWSEKGFESGESLANSETNNWQSFDELRVVAESGEGNYLIVCRETADYTGGAHGNYSNTYYMIDIKNKKSVSINDFFTPEGIKRLTNSVYSLLNLKAQKSSYDLLSSQENFALTNNFYINKSNEVVFSFNPYEVAPYAQGLIEINLNETDFSPWLSGAGKNIFAAFKNDRRE